MTLSDNFQIISTSFVLNYLVSDQLWTYGIYNYNSLGNASTFTSIHKHPNQSSMIRWNKPNWINHDLNQMWELMCLVTLV